MALKEIPFYNLSSAVGPGCVNKRTDVMLVQFFLHQIYSHPAKSNKPAGPKIQINGAFDGTTANWIRHFQADIKGQAKSIMADGRVDPVQGAQNARSSMSKTFYTISWMNYGHWHRYRRDHNCLEENPLVPGDLRLELSQSEGV
jgi:hypothetical protein